MALEGEAGRTWTDQENDLIVADYFSMLIDDLAGRPYNKTQHRRALAELLPARADKAIEFKHQNISAVLLGLGEPWIPGYKPARNFQAPLIEAVLRWLRPQPEWLASRAGSVGGQTLPLVADDVPLWVGPPPTLRNEPSPVDPKLLKVIGRKVDVAQRDARNKALGLAGEERVFHNERIVLCACGRDDLAKKVRWTSQEDGDGFGYDIASFDEKGRKRLIEVKTTNGWERTPFHISSNELRVAMERSSDWSLVRLYDFARTPRAFEIRPPLERHVELTPTSFLASFGVEAASS